MNNIEKERIPWIIMTAPGRKEKEFNTFYSLLQHGVNTKNIRTFTNIDIKNKTDPRPYQKVISEKVLKELFPQALAMIKARNAPGFFYVEDNTKLKDDYRNLYLFGNKITWLGWLKNMKHYIVGSKLIYFPKSIVEKMIRDKIPLGHIDRVFRNFGLKHNALHVSPETQITIGKADSDIGTEEEKAAKAKLKGKAKFVGENVRVPISEFRKTATKEPLKPRPKEKKRYKFKRTGIFPFKKT
jgi:hypothetical protein